MMKRSTVVWSLLIVCILLAGCLLCAQADELGLTGTVKGGKLNMRDSASSKGKVVTTLTTGTKVDILENDGTWCKVTYGKKTGYVMTQYLTITTNYPHLGWGATEKGAGMVNIRAEANSTSGIVLKAPGGVRVELLEKSGDYYRVRLNTTFGYIEAAKITVLPSSESYAIGTYGTDSQAYRLTYLPKNGREWGQPEKYAQSSGALTYEITYPQSGSGAADAVILGWVQDTVRMLEADLQQNHPSGTGTLIADYSAVMADSRYASVMIYGTYDNSETGKLEVLYGINIDTETGNILRMQDVFSNLDRALFVLESKLVDVFFSAADGYSNVPTTAWLDNAILTPGGIDVHLAAGICLPLPMGTQKITLSYQQMAQYMSLDSTLVTANLRVVDPTKPMIALTFDDGPSEETLRILDVLEKYNGRATFCVVGTQVELYGDILKRTAAMGNEIACHTWSHKKLTEQSVSNIRSQITKVNELVYTLTGQQIKVLRPP